MFASARDTLFDNAPTSIEARSTTHFSIFFFYFRTREYLYSNESFRLHKFLGIFSRPMWLLNTAAGEMRFSVAHFCGGFSLIF